MKNFSFYRNQIRPCVILSLLILFIGCNDKNVSLVEANNDSIAKYLKLASYDSLSFAERDKYNQKAFSFIDLSRNDTVVRWYLCEAAINFSILKKNNEYYRISKIHYEKATQANDTLNLARYFRYRAVYHKNVSKLLDSAFYFYLRSEKMYIKTNKHYELGLIYFYKGLLQWKFDDYLGSNFSANQSYSIFKNAVDGDVKYNILNLLGNNTHNLKDYKSAIKYHEKALELAKRVKLKSKFHNNNFISTSLNNIGNSYRELKQYKKAICYFKEALKEKKLLDKDPEIYAFILNNLGSSQMNLNDYNGLPHLFKKSAKIFDSLGVKNEAAISNIYLSEFFYKRNDTISAIKYAEKALKLAKQAKAPYYYLTALSNAGIIDRNNASKYINEYHKKNDSILFEERKARSQFFKIQLETDEIAQEKEIAIKQKWIIASVISGVLFIVILLFIIYRQRTKQKELQLLQNQQKANEDIYQLMLSQQTKVEEGRQVEKKRIALELHDGIMNKLVSTRLNLFVLKKKNDPETIKNCLNYIEEIHSIENEIRNLSHNLDQENLTEKNNFKSLLKQFVQNQNSHLQAQFELQIEKGVDWDRISNEAKMHLYRIIQEATNNINKHAIANKACLQFSMDKDNLFVSIKDDGIGFYTKKAKEGIGLKNMQQRMETIKGRLTIKSTPNNGTALYLSFPLI